MFALQSTKNRTLFVHRFDNGEIILESIKNGILAFPTYDDCYEWLCRYWLYYNAVDNTHDLIGLKVVEV